MPLYSGAPSGLTNTTVTAAGTVYTLTASSAAVTFGTTSPSVTLSTAGTWLLMSGFVAEYIGATFAANQTLTSKLRRTNNTATDVTGASLVGTTQVITTQTYSMGEITLPVVVYSTANSNDAVALFSGLSATPSAGSMTISSAWIMALKIG